MRPSGQEAPVASLTTFPVRNARGGLAAGLGAYTLWGFLPLLFEMLNGVPPVTIVAERTLWSLVLVGALLLVWGRMGEVRAALADRGELVRMALAAFLLAGNWLIYVYSVQIGQVLQASLGYFINPLVNVAMGVLLLGERLNRPQKVAIGVAMVAVVIQAVGLGDIPYIALALAFSFAGYGLIRKQSKAGSATGLFVETLVLSPIALGYLVWTALAQGSLGPNGDPVTFGLLALTGPATALPLLLFAFAVQRLKFTTLGMLQYLSPSLQFLLAVGLFGEKMNGAQLVSFGLIWLSLGIYTVDSIARARRRA
jgi:chloramphenicol-sensitive protein RarD